MKYLSADTEPVRRAVYGALVAVIALLVILGVITEEIAFGVTAVASAVLLIPAVEIARSKVSPVPTVKPDEFGVIVPESEVYEPEHASTS